MIQKIVVPLDGSKLAECALPYAEEIASKMDVEVVLVSVTERVQGYEPVRAPGKMFEVDYVPVGIGKMEKQATRYMDRIVKKFEGKGIEGDITQVLGGAKPDAPSSKPSQEQPQQGGAEHTSSLLAAKRRARDKMKDQES